MLKTLDRLNQLLQRAGEAVELPDDNDIALARVSESKLWPLAKCARGPSNAFLQLKRMRWATYNRLQDRYDRLVGAYVGYFMARSG